MTRNNGNPSEPFEFPDLRATRRIRTELNLKLIDGPNMSNLRPGGRDRRTYGAIASIDVLHAWMTAFATSLGVTLETKVSNHEGELLEYVHRTAEDTDAYLINPAGLNLQSEALREALHETNRPVMELHFANIAAIGYPVTVFTRSVTGMTFGLRQYGYLATLFALVMALDDPGFLGSRRAQIGGADA